MGSPFSMGSGASIWRKNPDEGKGGARRAPIHSGQWSKTPQLGLGVYWSSCTSIHSFLCSKFEAEIGHLLAVKV